MTELCTKALETGLLNQQVDDIVEFVQAWAGQIMRTVQAAEGIHLGYSEFGSG